MKRAIVTLLMCAGALFAAACTQQETSKTRSIVFADAGWDSIRIHNAVAGFIAVTAFGYDNWKEVTGSSPVVHEGVLRGEIDVHMENWSDNFDYYQPAVDAGKLTELGVNFTDNAQGLYVPRFVIEGDAGRGIAPVAPGLRTVADLKNCADVFEKGEDGQKSRLYGSIPGWKIDDIMYAKFRHYGLDARYEYFRPGSDAALSAALGDAYEKGRPIVGYYWEPTWLMGKYDFVLLADEPFRNRADFEAGKTAAPSVRCTVTASNIFVENNHEFCAFLRKYRTSGILMSKALAYMLENKADYARTAKWYLQQDKGFLDRTLTPAQAEAVRAALRR